MYFSQTNMVIKLLIIDFLTQIETAALFLNYWTCDFFKLLDMICIKLNSVLNLAH